LATARFQSLGTCFESNAFNANYYRSFIQQKYHFFFGNDPVPAEKLDSAIKGAKKEYAHALAWSNETGKGLLYYVKEAAKKDTPTGVIPLVSDEYEPKTRLT
jgi:hypothetical protein